jgi:hypothetical protein
VETAVDLVAECTVTESRKPLDSTEWRRAFTAFVGPDQFRKFLQHFRRAGRLRFWQEQVLERFFVANPGLRVGGGDLTTLLRVCELHGGELKSETVEVIEGNVDYAERYSRAKQESFPNSASGPWYTEGGPSPGPVVRVWYCPECRAAEAAWDSRPR